MTSSLLETIRRIVRDEMGRMRTAELAVVQEQHPHASDSDKDNYACTVALRDSGIVLKQVPVATPRIGAVSIPNGGDLVLVQFIGGDINAPIITGRLYNDEDRPPANDDGQAIVHLPLGAGDSDAVHFELHSGESREVLLKLGGGLSLSVRDDDPVVEVDVDSGKATLKIERDGTITMTGSTINMEADEINVEASNQLNLKGNAAVNINEEPRQNKLIKLCGTP